MVWYDYFSSGGVTASEFRRNQRVDITRGRRPRIARITTMPFTRRALARRSVKRFRRSRPLRRPRPTRFRRRMTRRRPSKWATAKVKTYSKNRKLRKFTRVKKDNAVLFIPRWPTQQLLRTVLTACFSGKTRLFDDLDASLEYMSTNLLFAPFTGLADDVTGPTPAQVEPFGLDELQLLYTQFKVVSCRYKLTFRNRIPTSGAASNGGDVYIFVREHKLVTWPNLTHATVDVPAEICNGRNVYRRLNEPKTLDGSGYKGACTFFGTVFPKAAQGLAPIVPDDEMWGTFPSTAPTIQSYLQFGIAPVTTGATLATGSRLYYDVELKLNVMCATPEPIASN